MVPFLTSYHIINIALYKNQRWTDEKSGRYWNLQVPSDREMSYA